MGKKEEKFELDWDTADRVALQSLKAHLVILEKDLKRKKKQDPQPRDCVAEIKEDIT